MLATVRELLGDVAVDTVEHSPGGRTCQVAAGVFRRQRVCLMRSQVRTAGAMTVSVTLCQRPAGNAAASATKRFSRPHSLPHGSTTESRGS